MKFDLISDLHIDFYQNFSTPVNKIYDWETEKKNDVLVIAGDCSNDPKITTLVLLEAANFYEKVLFVDGNHEHYNGKSRVDHIFPQINTVDSNVGYLRGISDACGLHYLSNSSVVIDNTTFIGTNGWYNFESGERFNMDEQIQNWKDASGDFQNIDFGTMGPRRRAQIHTNWLISELRKVKTDNVVVVTHTIPHPHGCVSDWHPFAALNGMFENTFMQQVIDSDSKKKIKTWVFGHTHFKRDFVQDDIHFVCNPFGYPHENTRSEKTQIISVDTNDNQNESAFGIIEK
jgi:predicted phosphodiesterase